MYKCIKKDNLPALVRVCELSAGQTFSTTNDIVEFCNKEIAKYLGASVSDLMDEHTFCFCFRSKVLVGIVSNVGCTNSCIIQPREVIRDALLMGSTHILLVHNHPSGDTTPSMRDRELTKQMKGACELMTIGLFDHIIIGNGYFSFKEEGVLL